MFCVVCGGVVEESRLIRKAVTCSADHARMLKNARRKMRDEVKCRICNRPSTPEERKLFAAWRNTLPKPKKGRPPKPKPADTPSMAEKPANSPEVRA